MARPVCALALMLAACGAAWGDTYLCGKEVSDREFPSCSVDQVRVGPGGGRTVVPRALTPKEAAAQAVIDHEDKIKSDAQSASARSDKQLLEKFQDEAAHRKARESELAPARAAMQRAQRELTVLAEARVPLEKEGQFYPDAARMPPKLKGELAANDARVSAQRALLKKAMDDAAEINARNDAELERLKKLW